jgi:hypothetical protein
MNRTFSLAPLAAAFLLAGCSFVTDAIFPGSQNEEATATPTAPAQVATQTEPAETLVLTPNPPPALGTNTFSPLAVTPGQPTGTLVGQRVARLRADLGTLQANIVGRNQGLQTIRIQTMGTSQRYHGTVAAISTRLQIGTTPGNPVLVAQWNQAQAELDRLGSDITQMNSLANTVASDSAFAAFLLESTRATYGLAGAIDEDHRQLAILEDETNRTVVLIDRLLNELSEDVSRQTAYAGNERRNLTTLSLAIKNGELLGRSLANRAFSAATPLVSQAPGDSTSFTIANRRPLVVIRFDRPDVPFRQALYSAVSRALEARPEAQFSLIAVTPNQGTPADVALNTSKSKRNAETVLRALIDMGLPADRIILSSATSADAFTNEVHIYVQ